MRISDWSADVCSSDLIRVDGADRFLRIGRIVERRHGHATEAERRDLQALLAETALLHATLLYGTWPLQDVDESRPPGPVRSGSRSDERGVGKEWVSTGRSRG